MQSVVPVATQVPAVASLPQASLASLITADFVDTLTKFLAAGTPMDCQSPDETATPNEEMNASAAEPAQALPQSLPEAARPLIRNTNRDRPARNASPTRHGAVVLAAPADPLAPATVVPTPSAIPIVTPDHSPLALPQASEVTKSSGEIRPEPSPALPEKTTIATKPTASGDPPKLTQTDPPVVAPEHPATAIEKPTTDPTSVVLPTPPESTPRINQSPEPAPLSPAPLHAASPAAQIAPALVQMGHASDGAQRLTLRLDPPELGHLQIRIERPPDAPARVEITVEKSETLTLLLRDQPQLQRALDQAGVPADGRSVTFHVAAPEASPPSETATAPAPSVASGGLSGDASHGAPWQDSQSGRQDASTPDAGETELTPIALAGWLRGGLDITA
jgi:Flagellar hook-length control protein FliK